MAKEKCCFGVDVGGTTVKIGCFDKEGHLISKWEIPTRKESQGKYILPDVAESLKERMEMDGIELENVQGIGIGVPGPVLANGTVERCVNLGWGHTDMKGILRQYFPGVDIEAGNDANVAALGEVWRGAGRGKKNAVMVTLGTGVGGGVVIDGKIVSGVHGMGGEIGHIHIRDEDQDTCNCGGHGCLEQTSSRIFPLVAAGGFLNRIAVDGKNGKLAKRGDYVAAGVKRVASMIREKDFVMWPDCNYAPWDREVSLYAAHFLVEAEKSGAMLAPAAKKRVMEFLKKWSLEKSRSVSAYACHTLALAGEPAQDRMLVLYDDRRNLAATFLEAVKRFYADPENERKFQEWKRLQDQQNSEKEAPQE